MKSDHKQRKQQCHKTVKIGRGLSILFTVKDARKEKNYIMAFNYLTLQVIWQIFWKAFHSQGTSVQKANGKVHT